ncbi:MAG: tRNA pseudouridine(38-40) synthase TruA [Spirochaetota bacterium]|nr:tRNA pseudouridine(38-40) synthase TruA [Spirochaetota bacterium]
MLNYKLLIQYDGTLYSGWQRQKNEFTIQEELEKSLTRILGEPIAVIGSGRTDTGVHALGQVANFKTNSKLPIEQIFNAVNYYLPSDIRVFKCEEVDNDFHARFSAIKREYKYLIYNDIQCPPFIRNYVHFIRKSIDIEKLKRSLELFVGEHNFTSIASSSDDSDRKIRTIYDTKVEKNNNEIAIFIKANSFLRKMVRMIVGMVLDINIKDISIEEINRVLKLENRAAHTYPTAPAKGLYLNHVWY